MKLCAKCKRENKDRLGQMVYLPLGRHTDPKKIMALHKRRVSFNEIAHRLGCNVRTVYRVVKKSKSQTAPTKEYPHNKETIE